MIPRPHGVIIVFVRRLGWRLFKQSALLVLSSLCSFGAIRPSFYLNACSWNATEIVVLAPTAQAADFRVIEVIKGELAPGAPLTLPGLAPSQGGTARMSELSGGQFDHFFEGVPPVRPGDRLIVFLRRPGALPEYNPRPDLPVDTDGWQPANLMGDLRTSAVWIQDGVTYGFVQTMNPGPTHLIMLRVSETQLRTSIQSVLQLRDAMDRAVANTDPVKRGRQLAALFRSENAIAKMSALEKLKRGGAAETNVLFALLSDQSLLGWHQDIIGALAGKGVADARFASLLNEETAYWSAACRTLKPGWSNGTRYPDVETTRNHYARAYALLNAIHQLNFSEARPAVRNFAAVWGKCPPLERREETNQIADTLRLLLGH
jgi:hypothetical protein